MTPRASASWQTILADLSLILFMVTASALSDAPVPPAAHARPAPPQPVHASPRAEPVGVWTDGPGAPPLAEWLAQQGSDPRLRATVLVHHTGDPVTGLDRARDLIAAIGPRGAATRVVVEQGNSSGVTVTLGYDAQAVAR
ncbi:hypothetical protein OLX02_09150 [Novosphingobium sp. KCTC 2891]|uniref:hypothetical protein n=1 Tax=Novosphingobium sp. KCTC 2891 TaxID=2989730 RepID=UPI00222322B7|nr:hypothetical protein [Novosphingobium sp. KCTC 2891]MCW1382988.1 hypothetical protein [Novosphingobium sp. KCTC 2891]